MSIQDKKIAELEDRVAALEELIVSLLAESEGFVPVSRAAQILKCSGEAIRRQIREAERQRITWQTPASRLNVRFYIKWRIFQNRGATP